MKALALALAGSLLASAASAQALEPRTFEAALGSAGSAAFALENTGATPAEVEFTRFSGRTIFHDLAALQAEIDALPPQFPNDVGTRIWRFVTDNRRHGWYLTLDLTWWLEPTLFFNSSGLATCGEAASEIFMLAEDRGIPARRWALEGHVVTELWIDGAWHMYDGDYGVYFLNHSSVVADVAELAANPSLITQPVYPFATPGPWSPYTTGYAQLYTTTADNRVTYGPDPTLPPRNVRFTLPPGARLLFPGHFAKAPISPAGYPLESYLDLELRLPVGYTGSFSNPLSVHTIRGRGTIALDGQLHTLGSPELRATLDAHLDPLLATAVIASEVPTSVLYLVNPSRWATEGDVTLDVNVTPGAQLVASAAPIGDPDDDPDDDGIPSDGDRSGVAGDAPCADGVITGCDDNCPPFKNPLQWDADHDGVGNACDGDFDQSGAVGVVDRNFIFACMNGVAPPADPNCRETDLDESGAVDAADDQYFLAAFHVSGGPAPACGLGPELAPLLGGLLALRRRR